MKTIPGFVPAILSTFALTVMTASGATVWNVNVGNSINIGSGGTYEITTGDNYLGAATENTANSTWNAVTSSASTSLVDSTGAATSVSINLSDDLNFSVTTTTVGDEIFKTWIKDGSGGAGTNQETWSVTFTGLNDAKEYDLVVYSGWIFGPEAIPIVQTVGTGLAGSFILNSLIMEAGNPLATGLAEDSNAADVAGDFNYTRLSGLSTDGSGNLSFTFGQAGSTNFPINGFQLVQVPEPSASALVGGLGLLALLRRRRSH